MGLKAHFKSFYVNFYILKLQMKNNAYIIITHTLNVIGSPGNYI